MIKIICDRCGAEIKPGKIGCIALNFRETVGGEFVAANLFEDFHFCSACMEKIADYISNPAKSEKAKTPTKEEPAKATAQKPGKDDKATKPKRRIDYGKIMALHNAGWNNAKIADEMGMTRTAVAQAIYMYKKKHETAGGEDQ